MGDKEWEAKGVARWRTAAGVQAETVGAQTRKSQLVRACGKDADALSRRAYYCTALWVHNPKYSARIVSFAFD